MVGVPLMTDPRFVPCDECNGTGEITVNDTPFRDDPYRVKEVPCPACGGEGVIEVDTETMTLEEALILDAEKLEALMKTGPTPAEVDRAEAFAAHILGETEECPTCGHRLWGEPLATHLKLKPECGIPRSTVFEA